MNYLHFSESLHKLFSENPNYAVNAGIEGPGYNDLPDPSGDYLRDYANRCRDLESQALSVETADPEEKLDLQLGREQLGFHRFWNNLELDGIGQHKKMPRGADDVGDGIFTLFINDPRPSHARLENIHQRIEKIPSYLKSRLAETETPVKRWAEMDIEKINALPALFETIVDWAEVENFTDLSRFKSDVAKALDCMKQYSQGLKQLKATDRLHLDEDTARDLVSLKGIDLSLEEIHTVGCHFLKQNFETVETLKEKLIGKYKLDKQSTAEQVQAFLNDKFKVKISSPKAFHEILARYQEECDRVLAFNTKHRLFPIPEAQSINIMKTPSFMEPSIPAGAMMSPPPFRSGNRQSNVYLTLREDLMDEHTEISIPMMMVHEGIPGHHLQLTWGAMHPSVVRRHVNSMDQAEGWTTMLEDYMLDKGYASELADEVRFSTKRDIARIGARIGIDLFFMTGNRDYLDMGLGNDTSDADPFTAASKLLHHVTGFTAGRLQAELNWYSQERGYPLSYCTGNHLVWKLKNALIAKHPEKSAEDQDRLFHERFLGAGNMPMKHLKSYFASKDLI